jgi:hypothetical protein
MWHPPVNERQVGRIRRQERGSAPMGVALVLPNRTIIGPSPLGPSRSDVQFPSTGCLTEAPSAMAVGAPQANLQRDQQPGR